MKNDETGSAKDFQNEITEVIKLIKFENSETCTNLNAVSTTKGIKLLKLEKAKFWGDPKECLTSLETFDTTVHINKSISDV